MKKWKPPAENLPNIYDRLVEGLAYPHFFQLIHIAGYQDYLREGALTIFVPVENTIDYISPETLTTIEKALKDEKLAKEILENHIVEEPITLKEMLDIKELTTLNGKKISIHVECHIREDYEFLIDHACYVTAKIQNNKIETANIVCYNGFIHTIKGIIL